MSDQTDNRDNEAIPWLAGIRQMPPYSHPYWKKYKTEYSCDRNWTHSGGHIAEDVPCPKNASHPSTSETWFGNIFRINKQLRDIFCMNRYTYEPILVTAHVDIQLLIGKFLQTAPSKLMHPLINPQIEFNFGESLHFSENWRILRECLRCT